MKVALNTQTAQGQKSGVGHYVANLLEAMPRVAPDISYSECEPPVASRDLDTPKRLLWDQVGFPKAAAAAKPDLLHQPSFSSPIIWRGPQVVTLHDVITHLFPQNLTPPSRFFFGSFMPFSQRFADHFITISECSKRDIIRLMNVPEERITVTYLAASTAYHPITTASEREKSAAMLGRLNIHDPYILSVCTLEPRKNILFAVRAYAAARALNPETAATHLVLAGKKGWGYETLHQTITELGIEEYVHVTGYVSDEDLPLLYANATAFLFPSLYEGFGLPPLEAMQSGCPVICSDRSALPEVVGTAGALLDPTNEAAWAKEIAALCAREPLRKERAAAGIKQSKVFSWEDCARRTADVYRSVLSAKQ